jgi:hypothetical protein
VEHYQAIHNFLHIPFASQTFLGDLVILTEVTPQRTATEKHSSRPLSTADGRLFTEMGFNGGDPQPDPFTAKPHLICGPVHTTTTRTKLTAPVA